IFKVSDLLEELAPHQDREQGKDIADYLIRLDWRKFRKDEIKYTQEPISKQNNIETVVTSKKHTISDSKKPKQNSIKNYDDDIFLIENKQPVDWSNQIRE